MEVFCDRCKKSIEYKEKKTCKDEIIKGKRVKYIGKMAYCSECDKEIFVSEINNYNLKYLDDAYRKEEGLISIRDIKKILKRYAIGKRPLSLLLGWGEGTLTRYINGDTPSKPYSDTLIEILEDEDYYLEILEQNKEKITEIAYKKSLAAVSSLEGVKLSISTKSKLESAAKYLLVETSEITPFALQKLLYFAQGFKRAFTGEFMFEEECEAWIHGPVYRDVYKKLKAYGSEPMKEDEISLDGINLTEEEKELLDHIALYFGCYSGQILENMTHIEKPWRNTRKGLESWEKTDRVIEKKEIESYFLNVKEKYTMLNFTDIKDYSEDLFRKIYV